MTSGQLGATVAAWGAAVLLVGGAALARADGEAQDEDPQVVLEVTPWSPPREKGAQPHYGDHFKYLVELRVTGDQPQRIVADRRLLRFTVRKGPDSGRRHRCRHPDRQWRVDDRRVRTLRPGEPWREWIDLRMYCWGGALDLLQGGDTPHVEPEFGFRRRGRRRWVVRPPEGKKGETLRELQAEPLTAKAAPERTRPGDAAIRVEMAPRQAGTGTGLSFRVAAMAAEGAGRQKIYARPSQWRFEVRGPTGRVRCRMPSYEVSPIVDFFRTVTRHRKLREVLEAKRFCPEGTFDAAGVYDVTAVLDLLYDGARYDLGATTGTFRGVPTPVRIRRGGPAGYVEHDPARWPLRAGPRSPGRGGR